VRVLNVIAGASRLGFRRGVSALLAAAVFGLSLLAVSPSAHAYLHGHAVAGPDHVCAVTLFSHGVATTPALHVASPAAEWREASAFPELHELRLASAKFRLRPPRGPPVA
jgi:hypothetical protein